MMSKEDKIKEEEGKYKIVRNKLAFYFFVQGIIFATWASRIPNIKSMLKLDDAALGTLLFAIPVGQIAIMPITAIAIKHFGSKTILIFSALLSAISLVSLGIMTTPLMLSIALFFFGVLSNLFNISVNTQAVNIETIYSRNIISTFHGLWSLGGFVGGIVSMILALFEISTLNHFIVIAIFSILIALLSRSSLVVKDILPEKVEKEGSDSEKIPLHKRIDPFILILGLTTFCALFCEGTMFDWSGIYYVDVIDAPDNLIRLGYIVCMSTMTIGRFMGDRMKSRFGAAKVVSTCGVLIAFGMSLAISFPNIVVSTIGFFFIGFGISSTVPICYSTAGHSQIMSPSTALACVTTVGYLGFLVGPPVVGFVAHAITLRWTFLIVVLSGISIALFSRVIGRVENK